MTVETASPTVVPGDVVTYTIELRNPSGVTIPSVTLSNTLTSGLKIFGGSPPNPEPFAWLQEVAPTVTPLAAVVNWGSFDGDTPTGLGWTGSLGGGAVLRISYRAQVQACYDPDPLSIPNQVSVLAAGGVYTDAVDIQVDCYPPVDPLKIHVSLDFTGTDGEAPTLIPGLSEKLRITAVNSDTNPAVLGLVGVFPSRDMMARPYLDSALIGHRVPHLGFKGVDGWHNPGNGSDCPSTRAGRRGDPVHRDSLFPGR